METDQYKRQIAHKASVGLIINSKFVQRSGWEPSTIVAPNGIEMGRVNVFGVITQVNEEANDKTSLVLTDHTGSIMLRTFDNDVLFKPFSIGEQVSVIGKPREFNNQTYINAEIIKPIKDKNWLKLRKLELEDLEKNMPKPSSKDIHKQIQPEKVITEGVKEQPNSSDMILQEIRKHDLGEGADIQEIIDNSGIKNAESIVNTLLETGEIYEIKRGKIKVL